MPSAVVVSRQEAAGPHVQVSWVQGEVLGEYVKAPVPMLLPLVARRIERGAHLRRSSRSAVPPQGSASSSRRRCRTTT